MVAAGLAIAVAVAEAVPDQTDLVEVRQTDRIVVVVVGAAAVSPF